MCHNAWAQVTGKTIANCFFYKAGFKKEAEIDKDIFEDVSVPDNWEAASQEGGVSFEDFVNLDESAAISGELTDQEILADVTTRKKTDNLSDEEEERSEVADKPIPTSSEERDYLHQLRRYVEGQASIRYSVFQARNVFHEFVLLQIINSTRQLKISFKKKI